ncbi:MAG: acyl-CoA thioesterase II [Caulobacteraceae bacterium]|nr:acyl-CoA thioesterase II [Caulobacteraceae bacterium]
MSDVENLVETLALEPIEMNLFRGTSPVDGGPRIFGGHVIAQSLLAAYETVQDRICHSIHCYFIRPGDPKVPILYEVDRARDGASFTTRRVVAIQHGEQIFNLAGSFQVPEEGLEHQAAMPYVSPPETLGDGREQFRAMAKDMTPEMRKVFSRPRPIDMRMATPSEPNEVAPPINNVWMRAKAPIGPDAHLHQALLAYASDMSLLGTAMRPHGVHWQTPGMQSASLDHAIWFHRPSNFNDWHLYAQDTPSGSGARGFIRGQLFTQDGTLVASVAQEGLIRMRKPKVG